MSIKSVLACLLSLTLIAVAPLVPMGARADMLSTSMILTEAERSARVDMVESYLDREDVRNQMEAMGVDPALAAERVAALTDGQLQQLALNIESSPAGSGDLGFVIAVLVILLILELLGVTNIFR